MNWSFQDRGVQVPSTADIPPQYSSRGTQSDVVQQVLDLADEWEFGNDFVDTVQLDGARFMPIVVPLKGRKPWWGVYAGHRARKPQASPFIKVNLSQVERTDKFTIELTQSPRNPRLVRAYPGEYIPPLPWMISAKDAPGGVRACQEFWRRNAYVYRRGAERSRLREPAWFRS